MAKVLLAVDLSYQMYRASASHSNLSSVHGVFTGGLYGFLQSIAKAIRETNSTHVVACRDSKPYLRTRDYPAYKQVRKKSQDPELRKMFDETEPLVLELLSIVGVPVWSVPGFESDDLIAHAATTHRSRFTRIIAASNDSDLYQLFSKNSEFSVYRDSAITAITADRLRTKTGLSPDEFMLASALQGTHNDIEGIKGVGEITASKAVKDAAVMRKYRDSHGHIIDRNLALIKLPHPEFPRQASLPTRTGKFDQRTLYRWLSTYDIDCTLSMVNAFEQIDN